MLWSQNSKCLDKRNSKFPSVSPNFPFIEIQDEQLQMRAYEYLKFNISSSSASLVSEILDESIDVDVGHVGLVCGYHMTVFLHVE